MSGYYSHEDGYYPQEYAACPPPHPHYPPPRPPLASRGGRLPQYQPPRQYPPQPPPRQHDQYQYYDYHDYREATTVQDPYQQQPAPHPRYHAPLPAARGSPVTRPRRSTFRGFSTRGGVAQRGMARGGTSRGGMAIGPEENESDEFSCSKKSPLKALVSLYPNIEFAQTMQMHNELGHAFGFQVEVTGKTFYGEATSVRNAKSLAALDALTYLKAVGCENLVSPCNEYEEMKRVQAIKELQTSKSQESQSKRIDSSGKGNPAVKRQKYTEPTIPLPYTPALVNFAFLRQKYIGHHNEGGFTQTFSTPTNAGYRTCVLIVQDHVFQGEGITDKIARDQAAGEAIEFFKKNPPAFVKALKPKTAKAKEAIYDRADPEDYLNMLYCKAWKFAVELTKDLNPVYTHKQNLAFVLKIYGEKENIDEVEVVAMGSGAKIISLEYMSADGRAIHDCSAEALCIRAFRRYIVNQLMALGKEYKNTVFRRTPFGRIILKEGYKFVLVKNCSPMGDCKEFDSKFYNSLKNSTTFQHSISHINVMKSKNIETPFDTSNQGKIHLYRKMALDHVPDQCLVPTPDNKTYLRTTVSPSDKLALRNIVGVQGALLSTIIDNVYFPDLYIGRAYDEEAMKRAVYGRLQGVRLPPGVTVREPEIHRLTWKPSRMADKTTVYCFVWCEGCHLDVIRSDIGRVVEMIKPSDISDISEDMLKAYDSKELRSAQPSQFCSYNYYVQFTELLKSLGKAASVESLTKLKKSATVYQQSKEAVYEAFEQNNLGSWPKKSIFPNY